MNACDYVLVWVGFTRQTNNTFTLVQLQKEKEMQISPTQVDESGEVPPKEH